MRDAERAERRGVRAEEPFVLVWLFLAFGIAAQVVSCVGCERGRGQEEEAGARGVHAKRARQRGTVKRAAAHSTLSGPPPSFVESSAASLDSATGSSSGTPSWLWTAAFKSPTVTAAPAAPAPPPTVTRSRPSRERRRSSILAAALLLLLLPACLPAGLLLLRLLLPGGKRRRLHTPRSLSD